MALNIFISTKDSPTGAIVISKSNPTPIPFRSIVLGNTLDTNIYLVDGLGDFDDASGDASYSVAVGIGVAGGGGAWGDTTRSPLTKRWKGKLSTHAQTIAGLFYNIRADPIQPSL